MMVGKRIEVKGIVQGVGFRPFIYTLAKQLKLKGWVKNTSNGVIIEVDGETTSVDQFIRHITNFPPPLAHIDTLESFDIPHNGYKDFQIYESESIQGAFVPISPDMAVCDDCRRELFDPDNPRFRYPFINCTNCGPRFTIIKDIPYDRLFTTMADFPMCDFCETEYKDPANRRFHAQPVACPTCGPYIWLEINGKEVADHENALQRARQMLKGGKILAIKGLGGFHLACDASNNQAVLRLRERKHRSEKPLAVMAFDTATAQKYCELSQAEINFLESKEKPIVLARKRITVGISDAVAPKTSRLGIMLPYTPLHLLLLEPQKGFPDILVMTSANLSEEPIAYTNSDAFSRLETIADAFLIHNREIYMRADDSVLTAFRNQAYLSRRARGFAPQPIPLPEESPMILATGAELKNTFCLSKDRYAFLSHHIGDLENAETLRSFEKAIIHYERIFRVQPDVIACDLHPDYLASQYAEQRACREELPLLQIQHHHAHLAACLADNGWNSGEKVIGIILDGTGLGSDNTIWGGEFLLGNYDGFERKYHLQTTPQPGGDAATQIPSRMALAHLWQASIPWDENLAPVDYFTDKEKSVLQQQLKQSINSPLTSSMGRLFDAAAALIGIREKVAYEAQAAIELEALCVDDEKGYYPVFVEQDQIKVNTLWQQLIQDIKSQTPVAILATRFHNSIVKMIHEVTLKMREESGINVVVLSGGVWQNEYLLSHTIPLLEKSDFQILWHHQVPTNDGGISLGQLMVAIHSIRKTERG